VPEISMTRQETEKIRPHPPFLRNIQADLLMIKY
jgi:hypothetical protein